MKEAQSLMLGVAIGAGLTFLLDPRQSGARIARIRDKSRRAVHELEHAAAIGARDLEHRIEGAVARTRGSDRHVADGHVLEERVRAVLGRHCSHPSAIEVTAKSDGLIELEGPILESDVEDVLHAVRRVPGVELIDDDLEVHASPDDVPALKGGHVRRRRRRVHVTPAEKLLAGIGFGGVAVASLFRGHPLGFIVGTTGVLALARSINARSEPLFPKWGALRQPIRDRRGDEVPDLAMSW
jgi:hypothetical protein